MIDNISQIQVVKASDLPPTFDILVGTQTYRFEVAGMGDDVVWLHCTDTNESMWIDPNDEMSILIPDTWENAKWDISFDLMQRGAL
jgi:hypothetical protein